MQALPISTEFSYQMFPSKPVEELSSHDFCQQIDSKWMMELLNH